MMSSEPDNQNMELDIEEQPLTRKPINSYREKNKKTKNWNNPEDSETLHPRLDESDDSNMNDDTHSVQNGLEDQEIVDCMVSNFLNEVTQMKSQSNAHSDINVDQGLSQKEALAALIAASVEKKVHKRKKQMSVKPIQLSKSQIPIPPERSTDQIRFHRQIPISPERSTDQIRVHQISQTRVHQNDSPENGPRNFTLLAGIVLLLVTASICTGFNLSEKEKDVTWNYQSIVSSFTPSFKGQPEYSFKVLKSALRAINQTEPSAPAVILFLASKGAENLARSLGEKLVHSVSASPIKISGKDYQELDSDSGKKRIDDTLRLMKKDSGSEYGAVLVEDLHLIPGETALMFHTYCDNENAPYKHAVYALIVHMEEAIPVKSRVKDWDEAAYKRLNRAWSDIDEDQRGPLLSRLTVSVSAIVENDKAV